jgi:pimeloyl-ACP methyl ester carboxylesterase
MLHQIGGCEGRSRQVDVLFVHGLGGDAFGTWRYGTDEATSWPHWLARQFPTVGVWSLGYAASPTRWQRLWQWGSRDAGHAMALPDRARQVLDEMVQCDFGQRPIFFIGHSLGGLLVKQVLRTAADDVSASQNRAVYDKTRAVLFLATPHGGAALASLLDAFRTIFGVTVGVEDLRAHDAHLGDLYDWYRHHADQAGIQTATYFETLGVGGALTIVNRTSAQAGVGANAIPLDEDHLSIAKPRSLHSQVYGAACRLLRECALPAELPCATVPDPPPVERQRRHGPLWAVAGALAAIVAITAGVFWLRSRPLRVPFGPDPYGEIGEYGKSCTINRTTGELVLSVKERPQVTPGQEYAGCCVLFRNLSPGGRSAATATVQLDSPERELHVKLENVRDGYLVAWLHQGAIGSGTKVLKATIDNPVLRERVDKLCIAAKGESSPAGNTIKVSGLRFEQ